MVELATRTRSLLSYAATRTAEIIPTIFFIITINFILIHSTPGDPVDIIAGEFQLPSETIKEIRSKFGLDRPLYEQFFIYLSNVVRGDLGYSFFFQESVLSIIMARVLATVLLMGTQLIFSVLIGIILGILSAEKHGSLIDSLSTTFAVLWYSMPAFWLAQMLIMVFAVGLGWFPTQGMTSVKMELPGINHALDVLHHLFLPALTLTLFHLAVITRLTRASMLEVLGEDYITTARAKGLNEKAVVYRHALKNALPPVVTMLGINLGFLIMGAVLTETVFSWPGIGRLTYNSLLRRDYPVIMGILLVVSITVTTANLLTDILYAYLDPRVRYK